jgi:hypothetical protein
MNNIAIDDITGSVLSIRLINSRHVYKVNLKKAFSFSKIKGLVNEEILLVGIFSGKNYCDSEFSVDGYDFSKIILGGEYSLRSINFGRDVTFSKPGHHFLVVNYKDVFGNPDIIKKIPGEICYFLGFIYGAFSLSNNPISLGDYPRPYLKLED